MKKKRTWVFFFFFSCKQNKPKTNMLNEDEDELGINIEKQKQPIVTTSAIPHSGFEFFFLFLLYFFPCGFGGLNFFFPSPVTSAHFAFDEKKLRELEEKQHPLAWGSASFFLFFFFPKFICFLSLFFSGEIIQRICKPESRNGC